MTNPGRQTTPPDTDGEAPKLSPKAQHLVDHGLGAVLGMRFLDEAKQPVPGEDYEAACPAAGPRVAKHAEKVAHANEPGISDAERATRLAAVESSETRILKILGNHNIAKEV